MAKATNGREYGKAILSLPNGLGVREWRDSPNNDDAKNMALHANNKRIWDNMRDRLPHPYLESDALAWLEHSRSDSAYVKSGPWDPVSGISHGPEVSTRHAITLNDEVIGSIALEFGSDVEKRTAELGYWLGEGHWKKGIMSAVVRPYVDWTFETFGVLLRLNAWIFEWNESSTRVLVKAGFVFEGRREAAVWKNGKVGADLLYGCVRPGLM